MIQVCDLAGSVTCVNLIIADEMRLVIVSAQECDLGKGAGRIICQMLKRSIKPVYAKVFLWGQANTLVEPS